jgi:hypothetical protein
LKVRLTLVADLDVTGQVAFDRFGATDLYTLANAMQRDVCEIMDEKRLERQASGQLGELTNLAVKVEPLGDVT